MIYWRNLSEIPMHNTACVVIGPFELSGNADTKLLRFCTAIAGDFYITGSTGQLIEVSLPADAVWCYETEWLYHNFIPKSNPNHKINT